MDGAALIQKVRETGAEIALAGDKINVRYASRLPVDLRQLLKKNREDVVRCLSREKTPADLIRLAIQSGSVDHCIQLEEKEIAALVPPSDWRDIANCTPDEQQAWATAVAMRAVRYRGQVPAGWDQVAHCKHCGPVYSFHDLDTLSCGWCDMRQAGKRFPVPVKPEERRRI